MKNGLHKCTIQVNYSNEIFLFLPVVLTRKRNRVSKRVRERVRVRVRVSKRVSVSTRKRIIIIFSVYNWEHTKKLLISVKP